MSDSFDEVGAERTEKLWQRVARLEQELAEARDESQALYERIDRMETSLGIYDTTIRNLAECSSGLLELFENMRRRVDAVVAVVLSLTEAREEAR